MSTPSRLLAALLRAGDASTLRRLARALRDLGERPTRAPHGFAGFRKVRKKVRLPLAPVAGICRLIGMTTTLFHGGHERITVPGPRGVFCSESLTVALSHGPVVSTFEIDDGELLSNYSLNYEIDDVDTIRAELERALPAGSDIDRAWEIVVESAGCEGAEDELELFGASDAAEAGWEAQRIRGRVALALGYRAVEMRDEHGTSWLVVR